MSAVEMIIEPRRRDLGGFEVGRVLPYAKRRMIGPFIFFDEMGPADFAPGKGVDVRPHPHIGLSTVTYMFSGELRHKDSLGFDQVIRPGDVNWMTAGAGIAHSERTDAGPRAEGQHMHGIQTWIALPDDAAETAPEFHHHPKADLPLIERGRASMRLIAGRAFGETSPVKTYSPMFYLAIEADAGAAIDAPPDDPERALYIVDGAARIDGEVYDGKQLVVLKPGAAPVIETTAASRMMLLGGAPVGERLIWWNFVATSQARLDQAKADWRASAEAGFKASVFSLPPDEEEFIPLPEH